MKVYQGNLFLITVISMISGQISYTGSIDKFTIELVLYSDNQNSGMYMYKKYNDPIALSGTLSNDTLVLYETDKKGNKTASFTFNEFSISKKLLAGFWKKLNDKTELRISLTKKSEIKSGENIKYDEIEVSQPFSLKDRFFKLVYHKDIDESSPIVSGIRIYSKKTAALLQQIRIECSMDESDDCVSFEDYNSDGYLDFSVFETRDPGGEEARTYFLFDCKDNSYYDQGFSGTNLEFNSDSTVNESTSCCGHTVMTRSTYKIKENELILVNKYEARYDSETNDLIEEKCTVWDEFKKGEIEVECKK